MDKYAQINKMILDLNTVTVAGAHNLSVILNTIRNLDELKKRLMEEDQAHAQDHNQ